MVAALPPEASIAGNQFRIIPSTFPPINFFERLVTPDRMDELFYLESLTNDRLRDEAGDIALVALEDRVVGPGASPVMAAFTHTGMPSRFSDGSFGVYYAGRDLETAIAETAFHRARFLSWTNEEPGEIAMRVYVGTVEKPLHDLRGSDYKALHDPDDWTPSQAFGKHLRATGAWGTVYHSVRRAGGECIAALRPPAVSIPMQGAHLGYVWDGRQIVTIYEKRSLT